MVILRIRGGESVLFSLEARSFGCILVFSAPDVCTEYKQLCLSQMSQAVAVLAVIIVVLSPSPSPQSLGHLVRCLKSRHPVLIQDNKGSCITRPD